MRKIWTAVLVASLACIGTSQTYNVLDAFSNASSTNGPWQLGWRNPTTTFQPMNIFGSQTFTNGSASRWKTTVYGPAFLGFYRNYNNYTLNLGDPASTIIPANDWLLHTEIGNVDAVVRFTAPTSGLYTVAGSAARLSQYGGSVRVLVEANGTAKTSKVLSSNGYVYQSLDTVAMTLNAGDRIDFVVNENGDPFGDSTGLRATILAVPEPATWASLLLGGLLLRRRPQKA